MGGFVAGAVHRALLAQWPGASIYGLDRVAVLGRGTTLVTDLLDASALNEALGRLRPDILVHLAGVIHSSDWDEHYRGNVRATANLLDALLEQRLSPQVVVAGSAAEYGAVRPEDLPIEENLAPNPISPYGVAKAWQTTLARSYGVRGLNIVIARIFNIVGRDAPTSSSLGSFAQQIRDLRGATVRSPMRVGNLAPKRDFIDVEDVGRALAALARHGRPGEIYNVCSGQAVSMREALDLMLELSGLAVDVVVDPARVRQADIPESRGSAARLRRDTGWAPASSLRESLRTMVG